MLLRGRFGRPAATTTPARANPPFYYLPSFVACDQYIDIGVGFLLHHSLLHLSADWCCVWELFTICYRLHRVVLHVLPVDLVMGHWPMEQFLLGSYWIIIAPSAWCYTFCQWPSLGSLADGACNSSPFKMPDVTTQTKSYDCETSLPRSEAITSIAASVGCIVDVRFQEMVD